MNPRRTLGLTLGLLLALVGARWIASDDSGARGAPTPMLPTPGLTPGRVEPDGYAPGLGAPDAPDSGRSAIESAALPAAGEQAAAGQAAGVPFRVHVLDDQGRMHERESGRLRVVLWEGGAGSFLEVQVHEGVFTLEAAPAGGVKADSGTLGGRGVLPEPAARGGTGQPGQEPRGGAGGPLVLRWAPLALLRVVDAVSGRDLPEVEVYARGGLDHGLGAHPGLVPAERLVTGPSPISLEVSDFELSGAGGVVYAHARGHAWGQARVALARGGETTLRLQPGGDLEVGLVGAELPPLAYLRLRADLDGRVLAEVTLAGARRPVLLTGLPLGSLLASVEVGDRTAEPELLGRAQAEITPGLTRVEVVIEPRVPAALAALAGVVVLPSAWELGERKLRLQRIGGSLWDPEDAFELPLDRPRAGSEDEYPFDAGRVRTGRWLLELEELRTSLAVDVPAQGCRNARLVIGPPAELLVRVIDGTTGAPLRPAFLSWLAPRPEHSGGTSPKPAPFDEERQAFVVRAPVGEVVLWTALEGYESPTGERGMAHVGPGSSVHRLELQPYQGIRLIARDGERELRIDPWKTAVRAIDHDGQRTGATQSLAAGGPGRVAVQVAVHVDRPGEYSVTLPPIDGYLPPGEQRVRVPAGQLVDLVFELQRTP